MKNTILFVSLILSLCSCDGCLRLRKNASSSDLRFSSLAKSWDEAIPLGNGTLGVLIWQKDSSLRFSLDRKDLWDLRPMYNLSGPTNKFEWVKKHIRANNYLPVQKKFDHPYDKYPAPSKIPGAALEFSLKNLGEPISNRLYLNNALSEIKWKNGVTLKSFVHAKKPVGWFIFENLNDSVYPKIIPPVYDSTASNGGSSVVEGLGLQKLGYKQGVPIAKGHQIVYHQEGWGGFSYDVVVRWIKHNKTLRGVWSITSSLTDKKADDEVRYAIERGIYRDYKSHQDYWTKYWAKSKISVPDSILQKQYDNEMYKFACTTRENSYPISLQSVWTADNGKLPPWKGDYHHDLNTQLSYWPTYTGNHLSEGLGFLNTLWNQRDEYKKYTRDYFEAKGMNVPGVASLIGKPMGGWIQYSMSQTCGAWLSQHFYLHWKYSADKDFLKERAYPFSRDVAVFLEDISDVDANGVRKLEFSSSPEIYDNSQKAWFKDMTNFDLSLMTSLFMHTAEMADSLGLNEDAAHWRMILNQLPNLDLDDENALTFAKDHPYNVSHRHFSHALAIHPLGILNYDDGESEQIVIDATLKRLEDVRPDFWTGYSYAWYANLLARAYKGEKAAKALRTFADCFCLKNTFHANGDQSKSGKSKFTYRPFTLEGNFAFAAGLQEMLLQSHTGIIKVFPAIPSSWDNVSFEDLRAMGGFLISAQKENGKVKSIKIISTKGGPIKLLNPFPKSVSLRTSKSLASLGHGAKAKKSHSFFKFFDKSDVFPKASKPGIHFNYENKIITHEGDSTKVSNSGININTNTSSFTAFLSKPLISIKHNTSTKTFKTDSLKVSKSLGAYQHKKTRASEVASKGNKIDSLSNIKSGTKILSINTSKGETIKISLY